MIFEINPLKDISKLPFYFDDHYLGKDKARNVFILSADKLYKTEVVLDGKVVEASWQKQVQLIKRKKAHVVYRLTEKGEEFLKSVYDNFGSFNLSIIEELEDTTKFTKTMNICDLKRNMVIELGMTILIN